MKEELRSTRILLIEDDAVSCRVAAHVFLSLGYNIDVVNCPHAAFTKLEQESYNLVITDLGFPEMDGNEIIQQLKQILSEKKHPAIVAVLSAHSSSVYKREAFMAGADCYLVKPLTAASARELLAS